MPKFHVTKSGKAAECGATKRACPLGGEHYDSMREAAQAAAARAASSDSWEAGHICVRELSADLDLTANSVTLPPGRYFLGDPCYTAGKDHTAWQQWVDVADAMSQGFRQPIVGGSYNGHPVVASSTAYGDGTYMGSNGVSYSVDAGLIGVVPEAVIKGMRLTDSDLEGSGSWVDVSEPTTLEFDAVDGTIYFGTVAVHTGGSSDEDEEWENEEFYCERCGDQIDSPYDSWCAHCAEEEFRD